MIMVRRAKAAMAAFAGPMARIRLTPAENRTNSASGHDRVQQRIEHDDLAAFELEEVALTNTDGHYSRMIEFLNTQSAFEHYKRDLDVIVPLRLVQNIMATVFR